MLDALKNADTNGNKTIELSELASHVQAEVPRRSAELRGESADPEANRAAINLSEPTDIARYAAFRQSARFGSRGENFIVAGQLP